MTKQPKTVAFILARGGSKRLPEKNIKLLNNKPLISYVIAAANLSEVITDIVVSSDCSEILDVVKIIDGCIALKRPDDLALDSSTSEDALKHAVQWYESEYGEIENIVLLQPTSPFTSQKMIGSCVNLLRANESSMTVVQPSKKFEWYGKLSEEGQFMAFLNEDEAREFSKYKQYVPSGNVYAVRRDFFLTTNKLKSEMHNATQVVSANEAVDIDYQSDFDYAEFLFEKAKV